jgi:hypothetical protein
MDERGLAQSALHGTKRQANDSGWFNAMHVGPVQTSSRSGPLHCTSFVRLIQAAKSLQLLFSGCA